MASLPQDVSSKVETEEELYPKDSSSPVKSEKGEFSQSSSPPNHIENTLEGPSIAAPLGEEDDSEVQIIEDTSRQLVVYNPAANGVVRPEPISAAVEYAPPSYRTYAPTPTPRVLPSVGAFTVQCSHCYKWRLIPTKEKYEEIRESILQQPFICERAREWRPDICCAEDADISQDGSRLWAIDKPNIAQPPPGWERLLRIRGEGSSKFADVYYAAPSGKRLRSMVEVQKYLQEHPDETASISQFSFQTPKPLQEDYVRKRQKKSVEPAEVNPLSWAGPAAEPDLRLGQPGMSGTSASYFEDPDPVATAPPARKRSASKNKTPKSASRHMYNSQSRYNQPEVKVENHFEPQNNSAHEF